MSDEDWLPEYDYDYEGDGDLDEPEIEHSTICPDCGVDSDTVPAFGVCQDCFQGGFDDY